MDSNPIAEIQQIRARIAELGIYESNEIVEIYFTKVEDDLDTVAEVHPPVLNSARLTEVLDALVDADPNSADIFNDLRAKSVKAKGNPIPGWLLSFLTAAVVNPFSVARIESMVKALSNMLFDWLGRVLLSFAGT
jgi:hypothetical protein